MIKNKKIIQTKKKEKIKYIENIIIGGGISGLYTFYNYINKTNKDNIILFEKDNRLGGRIKTFTKTIKNKKYMWEEGASRFNKNHKLLLKLLKNLGLNKKIHKIGADIKFYPKNIKNKNIFSNMKEPFYYLNKIKKYYLKDKKNHNNKYFLNKTLKEYAKNILTKKELKYLSDAFGYNSKLTNSNVEYVLYLIKKHYNPKNQFYGLNGGLNQIIDSILKKIKNNKHNKKIINNIHLNSELKEIFYDKNNNIFNLKIFNLEKNKIQKYQCKKLILALPKPALLNIKSNLLHKIHNLINSIKCIPMNRLYCIYPPKNNKVWFDEFGKSTTDSWLRYVIPINKKDGTIMISYTNDKYADKVKNIIDNKKGYENKIKEEVKKVFGKDIDKPIFCKMSYWKCGVSIWKKGKDYKKIYNKMIQPFNNINLYIIGENYSLDQAWIEGALDTSNKVLKKIII